MVQMQMDWKCNWCFCATQDDYIQQLPFFGCFRLPTIKFKFELLMLMLVAHCLGTKLTRLHLDVVVTMIILLWSLTHEIPRISKNMGLRDTLIDIEMDLSLCFAEKCRNPVGTGWACQPRGGTIEWGWQLRRSCCQDAKKGPNGYYLWGIIWVSPTQNEQELSWQDLLDSIC